MKSVGCESREMQEKGGGDNEKLGFKIGSIQDWSDS